MFILKNVFLPSRTFFFSIFTNCNSLCISVLIFSSGSVNRFFFLINFLLKFFYKRLYFFWHLEIFFSIIYVSSITVYFECLCPISSYTHLIYLYSSFSFILFSPFLWLLVAMKLRRTIVLNLPLTVSYNGNIQFLHRLVLAFKSLPLVNRVTANVGWGFS